MTLQHEGKSTSWLESGLLSVQECWPLTGSHNPWETRCSCVLNNPPERTGASAGHILSIPINSVLYSYCLTYSTHSETNASRTHSYRHSYCLTYSTHAKTNASKTHRHTSTLTHTAASRTHTHTLKHLHPFYWHSTTPGIPKTLSGNVHLRSSKWNQ